MKDFIRHLSIFVVLSFCISCTKTNDFISVSNSEINFQMFASLSKIKNYVVMRLSYEANTLDSLRTSSYKISGFAKFENENGQKINRGNIVINGTSFFPAENNNYEFEFSGKHYEEGKRLFGKKIQIELKDNEETKKSESAFITVPMELWPPTVQNFPSSVIDRNSNYPLSWTPDPNNEFHQVQIQITYYKGLSQYNDSAMPSEVSSCVYTVNDNGFFVIPSNDLRRFPSGSYVQLSIGRASTNNTGNVAYLVVAHAQTIPLLVVENPPLFADFTLATSLTNPCSFTATSIVTGGKAPYNYVWSTSTSGNPEITEIGYTSWVQGTGTCVSNTGVNNSSTNYLDPNITNINLKVTDVNYNSVSISKPLIFTPPVE